MNPGRLTASDLDGAVWRTSRYSGGQGECVEVATGIPGIVPVRDSTRPTGLVVTCSHEAWRAFLDHLA
jgi:streptogramin lyase